jgi:hypothetical protein
MKSRSTPRLLAVPGRYTSNGHAGQTLGIRAILETLPCGMQIGSVGRLAGCKVPSEKAGERGDGDGVGEGRGAGELRPQRPCCRRSASAEPMSDGFAAASSRTERAENWESGHPERSAPRASSRARKSRAPRLDRACLELVGEPRTSYGALSAVDRERTSALRTHDRLARSPGRSLFQGHTPCDRKSCTMRPPGRWRKGDPEAEAGLPTTSNLRGHARRMLQARVGIQVLPGAVPRGSRSLA